jgi:peptidoglycan/xylan/chitin deacetylase (PgdA/CDA1 family)
MYHDIVSRAPTDHSGFPGAGPRRYKLDWPDWLEQLDRLAETCERPTHVHEAVDGDWLLTFDDGGGSAVDAGRELARRGWTGHFLVTAGMIDKPGFVTADDIRELHTLGHVIGTHSWSHPERMSTCSFRQLLLEWGRSLSTLEEIVGEPLDVASVPGGYHSRAVEAAAAQVGIGALFTSEPIRKVRIYDRCRVIGRFAITRPTTAEEVVRLAQAERSLRLRRVAAWNARKGAKFVAGPLYPALRRLFVTSR